MIDDEARVINELKTQLAMMTAKVNDLTEKNKELEENEIRYREFLDSLQEIVFEINPAGKLLFYNRKSFEFFGYNPENFDQDNFNVFQAIVPEDRERMGERVRALIQGQSFGVGEYTAQKKDGTRFPILIHSVPVLKDQVLVGIRGVIMDISERKEYDQRLQFMSSHDALTGLENRMFFEQEMDRLALEQAQKVGLIICDLDGLKLVNDTLGHETGDALLKAAAGLIKQCFREKDVVARIGGDEFAVLIPRCTEKAITGSSRRLSKAIDRYNKDHPDVPFSLSIGFALMGENISLEDLYQNADNNMYRDKLYKRNSIKNNMVPTLLKALEIREITTREHAFRLVHLIMDFARVTGLPKSGFHDLRLFAHFHDIGKVGVPDRIINKKGRLTQQERQKMILHCEIGYRIALSSRDLSPIADWILKHHEWWDGTGYPLGLKGEGIPLECRILAIADAFDIMTNDRPYGQAISIDETFAELMRCAGSQFDPNLVPVFIRMIREKQKAVRNGNKG